MKNIFILTLVIVFLAGLSACSKKEEAKDAAVTDKIMEAETVGDKESKLPEGHPAMGSEQSKTMGSGENRFTGTIGSQSADELSKSAAGHPTSAEVKREVRVPDDVKAKWKTVNLKLVDKEKKTEELLSMTIGKQMTIKGTNFTLKVDVFLPHYSMFDNYITSKSNEPLNPAVLVELTEGGKSVAKGWIFSNFTSFNSYKHNKYDIVLQPISSTNKK